MKYSTLFGKTSKTVPHDAKSANAELLTKAGFIDKVGAGIYTFLPLGTRVLRKINRIIREEMDAVGGQEVLMPALHPIEYWEKTGRSRTMDDILYRTKGTGDKEFVLGPSHEETVTPLAAKFIKSYKDLPLSLYQIQSKFRDEPRAKSGLLRGREFGMKDMYSFHASEEDLDEYYEKVKEAYLKVYQRCGLDAYIVEASGGAFTDKYSHEFSIITPAGEDTIIICKKCNAAQNLEVAEGKIKPINDSEEELPLKEVKIKRGTSVAENAKAHDVNDWRILKTVAYKIEDAGYFGVVIRGDLQVNEDKLVNYFKKKLRPATDDELKELGLVKGFVSPVFKDGDSPIPFIADHSVQSVKNYITGANKLNLDLANVNIGRDFIIEEFTDLVCVEKGFHCKNCGLELSEEKAIEAGNIFKLGTKFSSDFDLKFTDENGEAKPVIMGCYGIGNTRLLGTIVEASHDENGIVWPNSVAPYQVHLATLGADDEVYSKGEELYSDIKKAGFEVLYDDRDESPGIKLKDADLIGIPLRIVISRRSLEQDSVECKARTGEKAELVKISEALKYIYDFF